MSTDEWVRRLNVLANEMDEVAAVAHPSMVPLHTEQLRKKWEKLAKAETDCEQPGLFE